MLRSHNSKTFSTKFNSSTHHWPSLKSTFAGWEIYFATSHQNVKSKHSTRFFSTQKDNAWTHISSPYRAPDVLLNPKLKEDKHGLFTILNPNYILNSISSLTLHYKSIGKLKSNRKITDHRNLSDLVVFHPERVAKQLVSVVTATECKVESDDHFLSICSKLDEKVLPIVRAQQEKIDHDIKHIEFSIAETIKNFKNKGIMDDSVMKQYFGIYHTLKKNSISEKEANEIAIQILINDEIRKIIDETVYNIVVDVVAEEIRQQSVNPLTEVTNMMRQQILLLGQYDASNRSTLFIGGGPASGKSTLAEKFMLDMKRRNLSFSDAAFISTDRFRKRILDDSSLGDDVILRGLYTQDEARKMTEKSFELIRAKIQQKNIGPHVIMETVSPINEEIDIGLLQNAGVRISFTSTNPQAAVEGNFARFQATGERLPPVCAVLGGQQLVSNEVPKIATHYAGKDVLMMVHDTDQMRKQKDSNGLIAAFVCRENKMIVRDLPALLEFVKKSHINPIASSADKIYSSPNKVSMNNLIKECFELFGDKEVTFVDPAKNNIDHTNAHEHAYATYSKEKGFTVINNELFEKTIAESAEVKKVVDYIKKHFIKEEPVERHVNRP